MDKDLTSAGALDVEKFSQDVLNALNDATKSCKDVSKLLSTIKSLGNFRNLLGNKILLLINYILEPHGLKLKLPANPGNVEQLQNLFDSVMDDMGRKIDEHLQEAQGKKVVNHDVVLKPKEDEVIKSNKSTSNHSFAMSVNESRPQLLFLNKPDNTRSVFVPQIFEKPNALKSLEESMRNYTSENNLFGYPHPYQFELDNFKPSDDMLIKVTPRTYRGLDETPLTFVDTEQQLDEVVSKLKLVTEFAIDLEHHSYRSFLGFTCLMQISTRDEDFIVDTLAIRHFIHKLNVVFTDPSIVKVLHGSDFDVIWLQKDFGVYLVNTFDTGLASRALKFPSFSYAHVLFHYCKVKADKQYQQADWRIRPLPQQLIKYAREDTHYLLYIYDRMKNDILGQNKGFTGLLTTVIQSSTDLCKKRYEKPRFSEDVHMELLKKSDLSLSARQLEVLRKLYEWRDSVARDKDESTGFILPNQKLLSLVNEMPKQLSAVENCLSQSKATNADAIFKIIKSVHILDESHFGKKAEEQTPVTEKAPQRRKVDPNLVEFDMNRIDKSHRNSEDLVVKLLAKTNISKTSDQSPVSEVQRSDIQKKCDEIRSKMVNPLRMYWPDSWDPQSSDVKKEKIFFLKSRTTRKNNLALPAQPEVVASKPVMLFDESKEVDGLLKSVRTQIREVEAPKRPAEEPRTEVPKKKVKVEVPENPDFKPHKYDPEKFLKMMQVESSQSKNSSGKHSRDKKRKINESEVVDDGPEGKKKPKLGQSFVGAKSFSFTPKNQRTTQSSNKTPGTAPRIPWPSKK